MKKLVILVFGLVILSTQACNSENNGNQTEEKSETKVENATNANTTSPKETKGTIKLTKQDFLDKVMDYENSQEWAFKGDKPCIIDFYADWCGPCKIAAPILEELAIEYKGKINIYKVDTQREQELAAVFGIQSIPAFLLCKADGSKPQMSNGIARTKEETKEMFRQIIEEHLLK